MKWGRERVIYRWMLHKGGSLLLIGAVLFWSHIAAAFSFYPPGPQGPIGLLKPTIQQRLNLNPGDSVTRFEMKLDGVRVEASWDPTVGAIRFLPPTPLSLGEHKVDLTIEVKSERGELYQPVISTFAFVVGPHAIAEPPPPGPEELRAFDLVNLARKGGGLEPLTYSGILGRASAMHGRYLVANPEWSATDPHGEVSSGKNYTGSTLGDRTRYYGFSGTAAEVINFVDKAEFAVSGWMDSLYHRIPLIHPDAKEMGYGLAGDALTSINSNNAVDLVNVLTVGLHSGTGGIVLWPYPNQVDVPTGWDGAEMPDPFRLYPEAGRPVGYTITMTFGGLVRELTLDQSILTGPNGNLPVMRFDPRNDSLLADTVAIIPYSPLQPSTTYQVHLSGRADLGQGLQTYVKEWSFTTASEHPPALLRRVTQYTDDGIVQAIELEGTGLLDTAQIYLGGLPASDVALTESGRLTFKPPAGYRGAGSLLLVTPLGQESLWRNFYLGTEPFDFVTGDSRLQAVSLEVHGQMVRPAALVHRPSGTVLLPDSVLSELGGKKISIPQISRSYWQIAGRIGDYTVERTAARVAGAPVSLGLPAQKHLEVTYVDSAFIEQLADVWVQAGADRVQVGIQDIKDHWARAAIRRLLKEGIVSGTGDALFRPQELLSRAAFVKMLVGASDLPGLPSGSSGFTDTGLHWVEQQGYLGAAVAGGIVVPHEYPEQRFEPDQPITREEMAVMVVRSTGLEEKAFEIGFPTVHAEMIFSGKTFLDVSTWTRPGHIVVAIEQGIIQGYLESEGRYVFRPDRLATRAEAAVMVERTLEP